MDQVQIDALPKHELFDAHNAERAIVKAARERQQAIHDEITRREHEEHAAKLNKDTSLDQSVIQK